MINDARSATECMATEEEVEPDSPLDAVVDDIHRELVRRVAAGNREANRDVYDALADE